MHASWLNTSSVPIVLADTPATLATSARTTQPYTFTLYLPIIAGPYAWHLQLPPLITPWTYDVSPANARPEYPRPQMTRDQWRSLNGEWEFASGALYSSPPFSQTLPETILVPYPVESGLSGIMRHEATMWYRRTFRVPSAWNGQRLMLNFDAVDWETTVYVNGQFIGTHRGGYDSFSFDITDHLVDGDNELIVYVFDPTDAGNVPMGKQRLRSRTLWYSAVSGIWQTMWLEPVPFGHITRLDMTPDIDQHILRLIVHGAGVTNETVEAIASINGTPIGSIAGPIETELQLPVSNLHLWSPDDPFLYDLQVRLKNGSSVTDRVGSYFGMRKIERAWLGNYNRPMLNHQFIFQQGVLDQGYWPDGLYSAPTDEALRHDIEVAKAFGYNMIRKHVKVEPQRWYYWADRLGMLVWQDMPSMQDNYSPSFSDQDQFQIELREMVDEHRNAPSIVTWIIFNEAWGQFDTAQLTDMVKALDPSRLVDSASGWQDFNVGDVSDLHNYVEPNIPPREARLSAAGEYGGVGVRIDGHMWSTRGVSPEWQSDGAALSRRYIGLVDELHDAMLLDGLSVAVYTQINDIEEELNGWQTYDRAIVKAAPDPISVTQRHLLEASRALNAPYAHIAHWNFDDGQGYFAHDTGGQNYSGLLVNGPQWTTGLISGALHFDGIDDFVDIGHNLINTGADYTVAAWVRLDRLDHDAAIIGQDGRYTSAFRLHYIAAEQRFAFTVVRYDSMNSTVVKTLRSPSPPQTGVWYFLTAAYNATNEQIKFYINGALVGLDTFNYAWPAPGTLGIGRAKWNGRFVQFWPGTIDDTYVFDRVLSDAEILALYNR